MISIQPLAATLGVVSLTLFLLYLLSWYKQKAQARGASAPQGTAPEPRLERGALPHLRAKIDASGATPKLLVALANDTEADSITVDFAVDRLYWQGASTTTAVPLPALSAGGSLTIGPGSEWSLDFDLGAALAAVSPGDSIRFEMNEGGVALQQSATIA